MAGTGILVVEDNLFCAYAITSLFEQYSVACEVANNGHKALEMIKSKFRNEGTSYKLIVMDLYMPEQNGLETTEAIKRYLKDVCKAAGIRTIKPYISMLTSNNSKKLKHLASLIGIDDFITKPIF